MTDGGRGRASVARGERIRLFCALQLAPDTLDCLVAWQREHLSAAEADGLLRVVPRGNLHVTLAFLGHRPAGDVAVVAAELRASASAAAPPALRVARVRSTRSVGMVVLEEAGEPHAAALAADLQQRLEQRGVYRREDRPWLPHVTVYRSRERAGIAPPPPNRCSIHVVRSALYRSTPGPGGARYDALDTAALGGT